MQIVLVIVQINEYNSIEDKAGEVIAASNADHFLKMRIFRMRL